MLAHWDSMVRVCEPILNSRDDAEDCASDALLCAMSADLSSVRNRQAWLVTVAKRRAVDQLRGRMRHRTRLGRLISHADRAAPDIADEVTDALEAMWLSRTAVEILTPASLSVLELIVSGKTVSEAADILGITRRAAESHLQRARASMRSRAQQPRGVRRGVDARDNAAGSLRDMDNVVSRLKAALRPLRE